MANIDDILEDERKKKGYIGDILADENKKQADQPIFSRASLQQFLPAPANVLANAILGVPEPTDVEKRFAQGTLEGMTGLTSESLEAPNPPGFDVGDIASGGGQALGLGVGFLPFAKGASALGLVKPAAQGAASFGGFEAAREGLQTAFGQQEDTLGGALANIGIATGLGGGLGYLTPKAIEAAIRTADLIKRLIQKGVKPSPKIVKEIEKVSGIEKINEILTTADKTPTVGEANRVVTQPLLDKIFQETTGETPKYVGRTINTKQLIGVSKDTKNMIRNVAREIPEFSKPKGDTSLKNLEAIAKERYGYDSVDDFVQAMKVEFPETLNLPLDEQVREIAHIADVGHKFLQDHGTELVRMARTTGTGTAEFKDAFKQFISLGRETGAIKSEFGLALARQRKDRTPEAALIKFISKNFNDIDKMSHDEVKALMDRIGMLDMNDPMQVANFMKEFVSISWRDKFFEAYISALLSGPKTHLVNATGNTLTFILRELERPISATVDLLNPNRIIQGRSRQRFFGETSSAIYGTLRSFPEAVRVALNTFKHELPASGVDIISKIERPGGGRFVGGAIKGTKGKWIRIPLRALQGMDEFFKTLTRRSERHALAYRETQLAELKNMLGGKSKAEFMSDLLENPTKRMLELEEKEALYRTFQTPFGEIGGSLESLRNAINQKARFPIGSVFVPFLRTPANIASFAAERMPIYKIVQPLFNKSGGALADEVAKGVLGSAVGAAVLYATLEGRITGGAPENPSEKEAFYAEGKQPYSIRIGDSWYSYGRLEPLGMTVGYLADVIGLSKHNPIDPTTVLTSAAISLGRNFASKTFLENISALTNTIFDADRYGQNFIESLASSAVPTIVGNIASITEPIDEFPYFVLKTQPIRRPEGPIEAIKKKIPGMNLEVMPVFDFFGDPVVHDEHPLVNLLSPIRRQKISNDPARQEVARLGIPYKIGGLADPDDQIFGLKLTRDEYIQYIQDSGQIAHDLVLEAVNDRSYQLMPDDAKAKYLEKIFLKSRKAARNELYSRVEKRLLEKGLTFEKIEEIQYQEKTRRHPDTDQEEFLW